jgi:DNA-binding beta-propeller fold protein YncE
LATGTVTSQIAVPFAAFGLKLSPDGRTLYVPHPAAGRVTAVDSQTGLVMRSYAVGGIPRRISFDRATGRAVVSNEGGWLDYLFLP